MTEDVMLRKACLHGILCASLWLGLGLGLAPAAARAEEPFPHPPALQPDIEFWIRVYTEVATDGGLLHDTHDLSLVYEVVDLPRGLSPRGRDRYTEKLKRHYSHILKRLATGRRSGLSDEERRVLALFPEDVSNRTLRRAAGRLRFQLGQADKFRAGIIRSGAYLPHIREILRDMGLPQDIAALPHVESSYTPFAYSRVGAAGLWQFTRSTGRRYLRVDHVVDERLDPYKASMAAARLLEQNRRVTGAWPLAITAYNHGASGMRRAARRMGTTDIVRIVRGYRSRTFGFASRNFYVEFLAAAQIARDPERYFGPIVMDRPIEYETIELPFYATPQTLAKTLGIDVGTLKEANKSLLSSVWRGTKYVPRGFELRVPRAALAVPMSDALAAVPDEQRYARQTRDLFHTVRRGEVLSEIARHYDVGVGELVALNGLRSRHHIRAGQRLRLPVDGSHADVQSASIRPVVPQSPPPDGRYTVRRGDTLGRIADRFGMSEAQLMEANQLRNRNRIYVGQVLLVRELSPTESAEQSKTAHPEALALLSPARSAEPEPQPMDAEPEPDVPDPADVLALADADALEAPTDPPAAEPDDGLLADPSDYSVASDGTIEVQSSETLGHYAEWLGLRASRLRKINGLVYGTPLETRQRLKLDFSRVQPAEFERLRTDYHRSLQQAFFEEYEIEGTIVHRVGPGDSLWVLSHRKYHLPLWLLRQYNPDVDFDRLVAGMPITIPKLRHRADPDASSTPAEPTEATS